MKDDKNGGKWHDPGIDHWERMTPAERNYEHSHSFGSGDLGTAVIIVCVVLMILDLFSSCGR